MTSLSKNPKYSISIQDSEIDDKSFALEEEIVFSRKSVDLNNQEIPGNARESLDRNEEVLNERFHDSFIVGIYQIFLVIITGCVVGVVTLGFQKGQEALEKAYIHDFVVDDFPTAATCIIMVFSAGISSFIALFVSKKWFPECLGGGIIPLKIAIGVSSPIPFYFVFARAFVTTVYISFGNPLGIEGPVLHISGAIASLFYSIATYFSREVFEGTLSTTLMVGTAAGISAAFNTPLAGIFYALEEFLDIRKFGFVTILVGFASVASILVLRLLKGEDLLFRVHESSVSVFNMHLNTNIINSWMLGSILLGIICGYVGYVFKLSVIHLREYLYYSNSRIGYRSPYCVGICSGLTVGVIGTIVFLFTDSKYSWGSGTHWIDEVLDFTSSGWKYLGFGIMKAVACAIAVSAGGNGGVFVPSLIIGASIGGAFASLMCTLFDEGSNNLDPINNRDCIWFTSFIEFGMAGVFTSILRLPLTSIVIVYELTNFTDIASSLAIPLLTCVLCSFAVNLYLEEDSIYELLIKQDGISTVVIEGQNAGDVININDPFLFCGHNVGFHRLSSTNAISDNNKVISSNSNVVNRHLSSSRHRGLSRNSTITRLRDGRERDLCRDTIGYSLLRKLVSRASSHRSGSRVLPDYTGEKCPDSYASQSHPIKIHANNSEFDVTSYPSGRIRKLSVPNINNGRVYLNERVGRLSVIEEENPHVNSGNPDNYV